MGIGILLTALVVGGAGPAYLRRAVDAGARPRAALGAWLGTGIVFLLLLIAAPVVMYLRPLEGFGPTSAAVSACAAIFDPATGGGWPFAIRGLAVALASATAAVAVAVVARALSRNRRAGREHARALRGLIESTERVGGVRVWWVADDEPLAYTVPSATAGGGRGVRHGTVVASTALRDLPPDRCRAVLEHEIAHLRGRHHVAVAAATALRVVLSPVPLLRRAAAEVAVLVELVADRRAARGVGGAAGVRGALADLGAPAGRSAVIANGPSGPGDLVVAAAHAVSPALVTAVTATTLVLAGCSLLSG